MPKRGRSKAFVAERLFVTENTVRAHAKRINTKLGIRSEQQLIDLAERFKRS